MDIDFDTGQHFEPLIFLVMNFVYDFKHHRDSDDQLSRFKVKGNYNF